MDNSILYVEPIYLRASQNAIPELQQVIVGRGDGEVVMRPTLSQALAALLGEAPSGLIPEQPTWTEANVVPAAPTAPAAKPGAPAAAPAMPGNVRDLAAQADREFKEALDKQRKGDWAGYGDAIKKLQKTIGEMQKAAGAK